MTPSRQFIRFACVGACGTAVHYALLVVLVEVLGMQPVVATTAGFAAGAGINYVLNRLVTFRSRTSHAAAVPKFMAIALSGAVANALLMWLLSTQLHWHYLLAQLLATGIVLCWNFIGNRYWTFRDALERPEPTGLGGDL